MLRFLKILIFVPVLFLLEVPLRGQSLIDLSKEEVQSVIKDKYLEYKRDNSVIRQQFNYLKYVNGLRTRTWIIYFTDEDTCRSTKMVCDYSEYNEVLEELNNKYRKLEESEWDYPLNKDTIQVILTRQEWYFTVREARKK